MSTPEPPTASDHPATWRFDFPIYHPVEDLLEPPELAAVLDASASARATWDAFPPSARKQVLWWVIAAARPETKGARIEKTVAEAEQGRRAFG